MIKIEHPVFPSPEQMDFIIEGMRNAKNSWHLSDSYMKNYMVDFNDETGVEIHTPYYRVGAADMKLMKTLAKAGTDHRKYLRMMQVGVRITAPLYFYKELDTYKVGTVCNSCSTMHKIPAKEFTLDDFSCEHLVEDSHLDSGVYEDVGVPDGEKYIYYAPKDILREWIIPKPKQMQKHIS